MVDARTGGPRRPRPADRCDATDAPHHTPQTPPQTRTHFFATSQIQTQTESRILHHARQTLHAAHPNPRALPGVDGCDLAGARIPGARARAPRPSGANQGPRRRSSRDGGRGLPEDESRRKSRKTRLFVFIKGRAHQGPRASSRDEGRGASEGEARRIHKFKTKQTASGPIASRAPHLSSRTRRSATREPEDEALCFRASSSGSVGRSLGRRSAKTQGGRGTSPARAARRASGGPCAGARLGHVTRTRDPVT